ncbi:unnamed protein product [Bursaphelenchus okinawaensis]|uniref:BTB domain-containing protein n=1 Tax=Bursaphelenchus okinawaensis TaxID=465554 RepID=A0A811JQF9_9BILA|nr:unnamed protein product [Bursaphelenchus okinawaensis]CAG9077734.1 unnamed protein product [Bursaphelenchus okinawaensis]
MLQFVNSHKKVESVSLAINVIQLAHLYDIKPLQLQCELLLMENLTMSEVEECERIASMLDLSYLATKCAEIRFFNCLKVTTDTDVTHEEDEQIIVSVVCGKRSNKVLPTVHLKGRTNFELRIKKCNQFAIEFRCGIMPIELFEFTTLDAETEVKHCVNLNQKDDLGDRFFFEYKIKDTNKAYFQYFSIFY